MAKASKKTLNVELPMALWTMFSKLCIDLGVSKTEAVVQYLQYLKAQGNKNRALLNESSTDDFRINADE